MEGSQRMEILASFRKFLDKFCSEIDSSEANEDEVPIRLIWEYILPSELEGEVLYWVQQYLAGLDCPSLLAANIARVTYLRVAKEDLHQFHMELEEDDDTDDADDDNNTDNLKVADNLKNVNTPNSESAKPYLDSHRLCKEVIAVVHDICRQWQKSLPALVLPQRSLQVCSYAIKNTRRKMEDKHVIQPDINALFNLKDCATQSYYAVFDGHGGVEAAVYTASHLHTNFIRDNNFNTDIATAIRNSYKKTDDSFLERAKKYNLRSGTTCVSLLLQDSKAHVSWLGDSQAVLVRNGESVCVMNPHKPERPDEKERIERLGGCVLHYGTWRVNGNIAVSRAIGDLTQKPFICSDAEVHSLDLDGKEDYFVLACDGAWDVLAVEELPHIVYKHISDNNGDRKMVAQHIVNYARDNGSNDNISVIVVFFQDQITRPPKSATNLDLVEENGASKGRTESSDKKGLNSNTHRTNGKGSLHLKAKSSKSQSKDSVCERIESSTKENSPEESSSKDASGVKSQTEPFSSHNFFRMFTQAFRALHLFSTRLIFPNSDNEILDRTDGVSTG